MLSGENGILKKAGDAKELTGTAQIQEQINLAYHSALTKGLGKVNESDLEDAMKVEFKDKLVNNELPNGWLDKTSITGKWRIKIDGIYLDVPAGTTTEKIGSENSQYGLIVEENETYFLGNFSYYEDEGETYEYCTQEGNVAFENGHKFSTGHFVFEENYTYYVYNSLTDNYDETTSDVYLCWDADDGTITDAITRRSTVGQWDVYDASGTFMTYENKFNWNIPEPGSV